MSRIPSASPEVGVIRTYVDWLVGLPWNVTTDDHLDIKEAAQHPRRGPLRPREDQGAHPRVPRGAHPGGQDPQPHPRLRRTARRRQDVARQEHRPGHGPQVRADEPRRHPRRGGDPRPPAHLHRRAARPDHPEHQDGGHEQPGVHARRGRQDRHGLPGRPVARPCSRSSTRSRTTPSRTTTSRCRSTSRKVLFIATGNLLDPIPAALRDRMEIIQLPGYTQQEKIEIGKRFLIPKQMENHGLKREEHRDHRRGDGRARPGLHPGGRRPEPRARDRQRHAQGRPARWPRAASARPSSTSRSSTSPRPAALRVRRARGRGPDRARRRASS